MKAMVQSISSLGRCNRLVMPLVIGGIFLLSQAAGAVPYSFDGITNNDPTDTAIGETQLTLDVSDSGGQVYFLFSNLGPEQSTIEQVFFDGIDGLLTFASIVDNPDTTPPFTNPTVDFEADGSPGNLPGGNPIGFVTDQSFSATAPGAIQGVDPGEYVGIYFDLVGVTLFDDIIAALDQELLRVGIHVINYASGGSESFVTGSAPVPEPATLILLGAGLTGLGLLRRRR